MGSTESSKSQKTQPPRSCSREYPYQAIAQKGPAGDAPSALQPAISIEVRHPENAMVTRTRFEVAIDLGQDGLREPGYLAAPSGTDVAGRSVGGARTRARQPYAARFSGTEGLGSRCPARRRSAFQAIRSVTLMPSTPRNGKVSGISTM